MTCREFEKVGWLFLSKELGEAAADSFQKHLVRCSECRSEMKTALSIWQQMENVPREKPDPSVRNSILTYAHAACPVRSRRSIRMLFRDLVQAPAVWVPAAVTVTLVLLFLFLKPFPGKQTGTPADGDLLRWNNDFISEVEWLDSEIDRVESGELLASYSTYGPENESDLSGSEEDWLAPVSGDLYRLRGRLESLLRNGYGI